MSTIFHVLCYLSIQIFGFICSHYVFHFSFTPFGALYLFKGEPLILLIFRAEKRKLRRQRKKMNLLYLKKMNGKRVMMVITIRFVLKYLRLDWLVFIYKSIKPHTPPIWHCCGLYLSFALIWIWIKSFLGPKNKFHTPLGLETSDSRIIGYLLTYLV